MAGIANHHAVPATSQRKVVSAGRSQSDQSVELLVRTASSYKLLEDSEKKDKNPVQFYFPADPYGAVQANVSGATLTHVMTVIIVLNFLQIGIECQWPAKEYPVFRPIYQSLDWVFFSAYAGEIAIKIFRIGMHQFFTDTTLWAWNLLDMTLTIMMLAENLAPLLGGTVGKWGPMMNTLRIVRSVRLIRILKVLRGVEDLMVAIEGLFSAIVSLFWIVLLMACVVYIFAIFFSHAVDHAIMDPGFHEAHEAGDEAALAEIYAKSMCGQDIYFCNLQASSITLIDMVMGATWAEVIHPIARHQILLIPVFVLFLIIASFGLLNVVVGVIVDATADTKSRIQWSKRHQILSSLSDDWQQHLGESNLLSPHSWTDPEYTDEMKEKRKQEIIVLLQTILESDAVSFPAATSASELMHMLDLDGDSHLTHEEFVIGVGRILLGDSSQNQFGQLLNQGKILGMLRQTHEQQALLHEQQVVAKQQMDSVQEELRMIRELLAAKK